MEPEGSLPHSQVPATCLYPEPDHFSPCPHPIPLSYILILSSRNCLGHLCGLFLSGFPTKTMYTLLLTPLRVTYPAHFILFDFITRTILGEQYRSLSSSLCSFFVFLCYLALLDTNILLSTLFSNTLSLRSSLIVSDQISHHTKQQAKL